MLPTHQREQAAAFIVGGVIVVRTPQGRQSKGSGEGGAWRGRSVEREESGEGGSARHPENRESGVLNSSDETHHVSVCSCLPAQAHV